MRVGQVGRRASRPTTCGSGLPAGRVAAVVESPRLFPSRAGRARRRRPGRPAARTGPAGATTGPGRSRTGRPNPPAGSRGLVAASGRSTRTRSARPSPFRSTSTAPARAPAPGIGGPAGRPQVSRRGSARRRACPADRPPAGPAARRRSSRPARRGPGSSTRRGRRSGTGTGSGSARRPLVAERHRRRGHLGAVGGVPVEPAVSSSETRWPGAARSRGPTSAAPAGPRPAADSVTRRSAAPCVTRKPARPSRSTSGRCS